MILWVCGIPGSGKTTLGSMLANALNWPFFDSDHSGIREKVGHEGVSDALLAMALPYRPCVVASVIPAVHCAVFSCLIVCPKEQVRLRKPAYWAGVDKHKYGAIEIPFDFNPHLTVDGMLTPQRIAVEIAARLRDTS